MSTTWKANAIGNPELKIETEHGYDLLNFIYADADYAFMIQCIKDYEPSDPIDMTDVHIEMMFLTFISRPKWHTIIRGKNDITIACSCNPNLKQLRENGHV